MAAEPNADCKSLVDAVMPLAKQMLDRKGDFSPYGAAMTADGRITSVGTNEGQALPASIAVIRDLKAVFIAGAKERKFKATALVYKVSITLPASGRQSDVVAVSLNHRDGSSVKLLFPYTIESKSAVVGQVIAQKGEADVFPTR
jgi:hypothetical protein